MHENVFTTVLTMSMTASVAVALIMVFRWILGRRLPKIFNYALWAIVLVRLLIPFSLQSMFSIYNVVPVIGNTGGQYSVSGMTSSDSTVTNNPQYEGTVHDDSSSNGIITFILSLIWFAGMVGLFLFILFSYFRATRRLNESVLYKQNDLLKSRIKGIMRFQKPKLWLEVAAVAMLVVVGVLLTNGQNQMAKKSGTNEKSTTTITLADVNKLLEEIMNNESKMSSSNPYDYVKGSKAFDTLVGIGKPAQNIMMDSFAKSNADSLREYIMAIACAKIMGEVDEKTGIGTSSGREWFYKYGTFEKDTDLQVVDADYRPNVRKKRTINTLLF